MGPTLLTSTLLAVLVLAYANGANDVSKGIATLVGSRVAAYRKAILWGTLWTVAGAGLGGIFATAMVKTFTTGILSNAMDLPPYFPLAVALGALFWVLFASWTGLPVSTTHALTGAICGAALMMQGEGGILWFALAGKVAVPLALSPLLALVVTLGLFPVVRHTLGGWRGSCLCVSMVQEALIPIGDLARTERTTLTPPTLITVYDVPENCGGGKGVALSLTPDIFHWLSSGLVSFARGLNDAPKIVALAVAAALITGDDPSATWAAFPLAALAMGMGSLWGGLRVTRSLAEKVTDLDPIEGLTANLTTAFLVTIAARMGLPVSTTHVSSGAIVGVGLRKGKGGVSWRTVGNFLLAWMVTLPASGVIAAVSLWALPLVS